MTKFQTEGWFFKYTYQIVWTTIHFVYIDRNYTKQEVLLWWNFYTKMDKRGLFKHLWKKNRTLFVYRKQLTIFERKWHFDKYLSFQYTLYKIFKYLFQQSIEGPCIILLSMKIYNIIATLFIGTYPHIWKNIKCTSIHTIKNHQFNET